MSSEKVNDLLLETLEKGIAAVEKGAEFLGEQIPLVVQELLLFKAVEAGFYILASLAVLYGVYRWAKLLPMAVKDAESDYKLPDNYKRTFPEPMAIGYIMVGGFVSAIAGIFSLTTLVSETITLAKILLAPRIYLLEYAASLTS